MQNITDKQSAVSPVIGVMIILVLTIVMVALCCIIGFNLVGGVDIMGKEVYVIAESNNETNYPLAVFIHGGKDLPELSSMRAEILADGKQVTGTTNKKSFAVGERVLMKFEKKFPAGTYDVKYCGYLQRR
jgi:Protein of unknown function (DUF1628).